MAQLGVLGRGKTGSKVSEALKEQGRDFISFHSENPPKKENLKDLDVICFLPGEVLEQYVDDLLYQPRIIVSGSTGINFDHSFQEKVSSSNCVWIQGHNYSLGMNLVKRLIENLSKASNIFENYKFQLHEVHHTQKRDAPSGTALKMKDWLGLECNITSERVGDVVGDHQLDLVTDYEKITIRHQALDRGIFASGALWAHEYALSRKLESGFYWFEDIVLKEIL